jgi:predicted Rossmann fold flavoprotein
MGHSLIPQVPSLFTFNIKDPRIQDLAGISFPWVVAHLTVPGKSGKKEKLTQEGPLLITHWGLSGPVILRLSAWGARLLAERGYRAHLTVDLVPSLSPEEIRQRLLRQKADTPKKQVGNACPLELPRRFWERLATAEGLPSHTMWGEVANKQLNRLSETLKACPFDVQGKGMFKEEFVTAGGIPVSEIDLKTMESRKVPGLYFAGEIIDVDGLTGGFNFQNAWTTGWIAGETIGSLNPAG